MYRILLYLLIDNSDLKLSFDINFLCLTLDNLEKPIISFTFGQAIRKLIVDEDLPIT